MWLRHAASCWLNVSHFSSKLVLVAVLSDSLLVARGRFTFGIRTVPPCSGISRQWYIWECPSNPNKGIPIGSIGHIPIMECKVV